MVKRFTAIIAGLLLAVIAPFNAFCLDINTLGGVKNSVEGVISYKSSQLGAENIEQLLNALSENAGDYNSDWYYIALSQFGINCSNKKSVSALKKAVDGFYNEGLENVKVTDLQRAAFALTACGEDITSVNGHNLLADSTYNRKKYKELDSQGVNSLSYALLLLDSKSYKIPESSGLTRGKIIDAILSFELENGGFALFGSGADIDITAIVTQALAPYRSNKKVKKSLDSCLDIFSKRQDNCGAYKSFSGKPTAESTAQVIIALNSLEIDILNDTRFIKDGNTALDGLNFFRNGDGGYCHMQGYNTNAIATYQSLCALVSAYRYLSGGGVFYDFNSKTDVSEKSVNKAIKNKSNTNVKKDKTSKSKTKNKSTVLTEKPKIETAVNGDYNSNTENKPKETTKSEKLKSTTAPVDETRETVSTSDDAVSVKNKTDNKKQEPAVPYISAGLLLLEYIVLFAKKAGGKK